MSWINPRTWIYGELVSVSMMNDQIRDNENALWPYSANGDIAYRSASDMLSVVHKGTALQQLRMNAGATAPEWSKGFVLLDQLVAVGGETSHIFDSIPQTFNNLKILISGYASSISEVDVKFNNDSGNNYANAHVYIENNNFTQAIADNQPSAYLGYINGIGAPSNPPGTVEAIIQNYSNSVIYKSIEATTWYQNSYSTWTNILLNIIHSVWKNTNAITKIELDFSQALVAGSLISIYGF